MGVLLSLPGYSSPGVILLSAMGNARGAGIEHTKEARSIALTNCICRTHYHRCDRPPEVCLLLDEFADKFVASGKARIISLDEVSDRLRMADRYGLIHMAFYMPGHKIYALCSCCACCSHDLQLLIKYHR